MGQAAAQDRRCLDVRRRGRARGPGSSPRDPHPRSHPGHCAFHFEGHNALFVGDLLCTWNPLTGRAGPQIMPAALNVSSDTIFESLGRIEGFDIALLLPDHGEPWTDGPAAAVARARQAGRS